MYVAIDKRNVIYGYSVSDCSFGAEYAKTTVCLDHIPHDAFDDRGIPAYTLTHDAGGNLIKRTQEEMDADYAALPLPEPTQADRTEAQALYTAMMTDTLLEV